MNTRLTSGLLSIGALLMTCQVSAATVQTDSANLRVSVGDVFTLTVQGVDFAPTNGGSFSLTWNPDALIFVDNVDGINNSLFFNGFIPVSTSLAPGQLDVTISTFVADPFFINTGPVSGNFDIATLEFTALTQLGDTDVSFITTQPAWVDENNVDLAPALQPNYVGASITITTASGTLPVPAAVWLFGSGLIGLIGFARRKVRV